MKEVEDPVTLKKQRMHVLGQQDVGMAPIQFGMQRQGLLTDAQEEVGDNLDMFREVEEHPIAEGQKSDKLILEHRFEVKKGGDGSMPLDANLHKAAAAPDMEIDVTATWNNTVTGTKQAAKASSAKTDKETPGTSLANTAGWRDPPKLLPPALPEYYVELPPEDNGSPEAVHALQQADERALALNLDVGLHLKKKRRVDMACDDEDIKIARDQKKVKLEDTVGDSTASLGTIGPFSIGHYTPKKEAAGKSLPPPQP